jgi:hypothetical protein
VRVLAAWSETYAGRCFPLEIGTCDRKNICIIAQGRRGAIGEREEWKKAIHNILEAEMAL